ncbi:MAG TPA: type II toxin-antitoxin system PrlF family antitoxin [Candidatus Olsenella excrementavium]|uniref:Type II toxin-antitoxin system PrlF family antitoxin n=1 Tax=Candidatus Olsenella excrementavium TaxID=2838709 RepID=A0A9D1ZEF4_9ACTN|nr:type II toxin-antitoxin system PrlF family antitoxin [Candidatus Olsenella excrementavium]
MASIVDVAKITSKGQVTIPASVRNALGVGEGDKVVFVQMDDGSIVLRNNNLHALRTLQKAFEGAAEEAGLTCEEDVVRLVKEIRAERARGALCG